MLKYCPFNFDIDKYRFNKHWGREINWGIFGNSCFSQIAILHEANWANCQTHWHIFYHYSEYWIVSYFVCNYDIRFRKFILLFRKKLVAVWHWNNWLRISLDSVIIRTSWHNSIPISTIYRFGRCNLLFLFDNRCWFSSKSSIICSKWKRNESMVNWFILPCSIPC